MTKTIDVSQLKTILANVKGAKPVTIATFTDARCKKTGLPYSEVRKLSSTLSHSIVSRKDSIKTS